MFTNLSPTSDLNVLLTSLLTSSLYFSHSFVFPDPPFPAVPFSLLPPSALRAPTVWALLIYSNKHHIFFPSFPSMIKLHYKHLSKVVFNSLLQTKMWLLERMQPNTLTSSYCFAASLHTNKELLLSCKQQTVQPRSGSADTHSVTSKSNLQMWVAVHPHHLYFTFTLSPALANSVLPWVWDYYVGCNEASAWEKAETFSVIHTASNFMPYL